MKYWEIIADNLGKAGWSLGYVSAIDSNGRPIWIADAHQGDEKRCLKKERERNAHPPALPLRRAILPPKAAPARYLSSAICAAAPPRQAMRNRAEKLSSRHRERPSE
jgi:hypothetical protein